MLHYQAPTQNQFQNPVVSQEQGHNNIQMPCRIIHRMPTLTSARTLHTKSISTQYPYTMSPNSKSNTHKSYCKSKLAYTNQQTF